MPTFDKAWAAANAACDATFGETEGSIEITPKATAGGDPNARRAADPTRSMIQTTGIFSEASDASRPDGRGISNTNVHQVVSGRPTILISRVMPWMPRAGDKIRLTGKTPVRVFEIVEVHRHEGSTLFEVTPI